MKPVDPRANVDPPPIGDLAVLPPLAEDADVMRLIAAEAFVHAPIDHPIDPFGLPAPPRLDAHVLRRALRAALDQPPGGAQPAALGSLDAAERRRAEEFLVREERMWDRVRFLAALGDEVVAGRLREGRA